MMRSRTDCAVWTCLEMASLLGGNRTERVDCSSLLSLKSAALSVQRSAQDDASIRYLEIEPYAECERFTAFNANRHENTDHRRHLEKYRHLKKYRHNAAARYDGM